MQRSELAGAVVQLKALGVDNMMSFDWLAAPPAEAMVRALELLHALGALGQDARSVPPPSNRQGLTTCSYTDVAVLQLTCKGLSLQ